jgi:hypothetical protein
VVVANASSRDPVELFFLIVKVRREAASPRNLVDQPGRGMGDVLQGLNRLRNSGRDDEREGVPSRESSC